MRKWTISYECESGATGSETILAASEILAWEEFSERARFYSSKVVSADARR